MYVLIACEESQAVCKAFRSRGHIAFSCDIQKCSGGHSEWHIVGDVLPLLNGYCSFITENGDYHSIPYQWDLIIAHPPCTYLSRAGAVNLVGNPERFKKGLEAAQFFMAILNANCNKICVENPIPMKCFGLPVYSQIIQPYQFGHPYSKATCLWLKNLWCLIPTDIVYNSPIRSWVYSGSSTSKRRSKTFPGIAQAMAEQWG